MRRTPLVVGTGAVLAVAAALAFAAPHSSASRRVSLDETCHGVWRWPVKTLADKPKLRIQRNDVQVAQLWDLHADVPLNRKTARIPALETTIYTLTATLLYARHVDDEPGKDGKGGGDQDYHLVIADPKDARKTMIVEFPDPRCAMGATAYRRKQIAAARAAFDASCYGAPRSSFANLSGTATITGVGFYDQPHAKGRSKFGVELHPVLKFESVNCRWVR